MGSTFCQLDTSTKWHTRCSKLYYSYFSTLCCLVSNQPKPVMDHFSFLIYCTGTYKVYSYIVGGLLVKVL